jgi:transposase-like protein
VPCDSCSPHATSPVDAAEPAPASGNNSACHPTRYGTTTDDATRLAELEREVRELRRANAILKSASAFFAAELDRPSIR